MVMRLFGLSNHCSQDDKWSKKRCHIILDMTPQYYLYTCFLSKARSARGRVRAVLLDGERMAMMPHFLISSHFPRPFVRGRELGSLSSLSRMISFQK